MEKSNFGFIKDDTLRENIKNVRADITSLMATVPLMDQDVRNCLKKTIIIYTASIVEALLLWRIKEEIGTEKIRSKDRPKHHILHTLHTNYTRGQENDDEKFEITLTKKTEEKIDADKLDFNGMISAAKDLELLSENLLGDIEKVRKMRNKLHIGGLKAIIKTYPQEDVDFTLKVLKKITQSIQ